MPKKSNLALALFLLRCGLAIFLGYWGIDKIISPNYSVALFSKLYFLETSASGIMIAGALELVLALFILLGVYKTVSYGLGMLVHGVSTLLAYQQLTSVFGDERLIIEAIPILLAFIALFLVRGHDTMFSLSKKRGIFS